MTKQIEAYIARYTEGIGPDEDVVICISKEVPDFPTLEEQGFAFRRHAARLERVLYYTLPGGVYDRLLGLMLRRKSSHFVVAHEGRGKDDKSE